MVNTGSNLSCNLQDFVVSLVYSRRHMLLRLVLFHRTLLHNLSGYFYRFDCLFPILLILQVIKYYFRRGRRVTAGYSDCSAALRPQIADAQGN